MTEILYQARPQAEETSEAPKSELDTQIEREQGKLRSRVTRKFVKALVGSPEDSGMVGASKRELQLHAIRDAESPLDEVDSQLERESKRLRSRVTRKFVKALVGSPEDSGMVGASKRELKLHAIRDDIKNRNA